MPNQKLMLPGFNKGFQDRSTIGKRKSTFSYRGHSCSPCSPSQTVGGACSLLTLLFGVPGVNRACSECKTPCHSTAFAQWKVGFTEVGTYGWPSVKRSLTVKVQYERCGQDALHYFVIKACSKEHGKGR